MELQLHRREQPGPCQAGPRAQARPAQRRNQNFKVNYLVVFVTLLSLFCLFLPSFFVFLFFLNAL